MLVFNEIYKGGWKNQAPNAETITNITKAKKHDVSF